MTDAAGAVTEAAALLADLTGHGPVGTWSAPGRVNLIGEHTDYNDGFVLPFAIQQRTHVALGARRDGRIRVVSTFDADAVEVGLTDLDGLFPGNRGDVPEWAAYPLGVAWALLRVTGTDAAAVTGVDLAIASDVPIGAGLSSSAAIEGAVATALNDTWRLGLDRVALAQVGRTAENEAVGAPTGIMDQMASMLGRSDAAIFLDCRSLDSSVVDLGFADAGLQLVVIDTGVTHSHATGGYGERRAACERGAAIMGVPALRDVSVDDLVRAAELMDDVTFRRVRHIVTENQRVLDTVQTLREHGPRSIGDPAAGLARVDARRLRDLGRRARHRGRGCDGRGCDRRAHDRWRVRGRRDRARRERPRAGREGCRSHRVRGIRVHRPHRLHGRSVGRRRTRPLTLRLARRNPWS